MHFMPLLITIAVLALLFLLLREVFCWYYKINTMVKQNKEQIDLLKKIADSLKAKEVKETTAEEIKEEASDNK